MRFEEKMDGVWSVRETPGQTIVGEQMRDGRFYAFDVVEFAGQDVRARTLAERLTILDGELAGQFLRPASGNGGAFLADVLARGGEGVVAKRLDMAFGARWAKVKRVESFDLVVTDKACPSIRLATTEGEDRGWCAARGEFDRIKIGQIVEIAAFSLTAAGKLREPSFLRIRHDKMRVV